MHSERYFLQFSYILYKRETLLLGLQNLLLQLACNAQHRDSKRRQTQACWKVKTFYKQPLYYSRGPSYAVGLVIILIYWRKNCQAANGGGMAPAPGWIRHCNQMERIREWEGGNEKRGYNERKKQRSGIGPKMDSLGLPSMKCSCVGCLCLLSFINNPIGIFGGRHNPPDKTPYVTTPFLLR